MFKSLAALNIYRDTCPRKILISMQKRDWKKLGQFHTHTHMILFMINQTSESTLSLLKSLLLSLSSLADK